MSYDIHFQPVPSEESYGYRVFTFGFRASLKVEGPQALVNRWVKTFMTPKGSNPLSKTEGTTFGKLLTSDVTLYQSSAVEDVVVLAIEDANEQVRQQDKEGFYPVNERLANATLLEDQTSVDATGVTIWIRIVNMAGEELPVRLIEIADR